MKILIIRSAPVEQFKRVFRAVSAQNPDAAISVLTHASTASEILDFQSIRLYTYTSKRIGILDLGWEYVQKLKAEKFDRVILIYTDILGQGYLQVQLFAAVLGAGKVEIYNRNGQVMEFQVRRELTALVWDQLMLVVYAAVWVYLYVKKRIPHANRH